MMDCERICIGDEIVSAEFGPLTILDTVRWAGIQENAERIHWDREFAREHSKLRSFIASGGYRQALLARTLTDWLGADGILKKMRVRHTGPTFEGDTIRYSIRVTEKEVRSDGTSLTCEVEGSDQVHQKVLSGSCVLLINRSDRAL